MIVSKGVYSDLSVFHMNTHTHKIESRPFPSLVIIDNPHSSSEW